MIFKQRKYYIVIQMSVAQKKKAEDSEARNYVDNSFIPPSEVEITTKNSPEPEELAAAEEFADSIEVYLDGRYLGDDWEEYLENIQNSDLNVRSVHIPHEQLNHEGKERIERSFKYADQLDAITVFDSMYIVLARLDEAETALEIPDDAAIESHAGESRVIFEDTVLDPEDSEPRDATYDNAHIWTAHRHNYEEVRDELWEKYGDQIRVVHFNDAIPGDDGYSISQGNMNLKEDYVALRMNIDRQNRDIPIVVETPVGSLREDLERVRRWEEAYQEAMAIVEDCCETKWYDLDPLKDMNIGTYETSNRDFRKGEEPRRPRANFSVD